MADTPEQAVGCMARRTLTSNGTYDVQAWKSLPDGCHSGTLHALPHAVQRVVHRVTVRGGGPWGRTLVLPDEDVTE